MNIPFYNPSSYYQANYYVRQDPTNNFTIGIDPNKLGRIGELSNQIVSQLFRQYQTSNLPPFDFAQRNLLPQLAQYGSININEQAALNRVIDIIKTEKPDAATQISNISEALIAQSASPTAISLTSIASNVLQQASLRTHPSVLGEIAYAFLGFLIGQLAGIQLINILFPGLPIPILVEFGRIMGGFAGTTASHFCYLALGGNALYH
ncbi:hypothetical protein JMM81_22100 [Bacillus sp. V3B]|uniref:hypothetical protein n=1 Tax=Bacillus sp. V3B TaxID=2804915 RepID=UPI00210B447C|nr:hypothetical protein [Bacillus sp. V3B]MCQ6277552.1 hypothetical protein [Bacillus sp. V3B]